MNWLKNFVRPKLRELVGRHTHKDAKDDLWRKCPNCNEAIFHLDLEKDLWVCRHCGHHLRISDRQIKRFIRVDDVMHIAPAEQVFDETVAPIWEQLSAIGESAPEGTWDSVPTDLSMKIDDLVYRHNSGVK